jgi:hypothetical protein
MQNYLKVDSSVKAVRQVSSSRVLKEGFFWFFLVKIQVKLRVKIESRIQGLALRLKSGLQ